MTAAPQVALGQAAGPSPLLPSAAAPVRRDPGWAPAVAAAQAAAWDQHDRLTAMPADALADAVAAVFAGDTPALLGSRRRGVALLTGWLSRFPGDTWQQRWEIADGDRSWRAFYESHDANGKRAVLKGIEGAVVSRAVKPGYEWFFATSRATLLMRRFLDLTDADWAERLRGRARRDGVPQRQADHLLKVVARLCAANGKVVAALRPEEFAEMTSGLGAYRTNQAPYAYSVLAAEGVFGPGAPPTLRAARHQGRKTIEQIVDGYGLRSEFARDAVVAYLRERQPGLKHTSLGSLARSLCAGFWRMVEEIDPGADSFRLAPDVVVEWKARLAFLQSKDDRPQQERSEAYVLQVLIAVRAFYLDIAEWAQDEPERWAHVVAPCPVKGHETAGHTAIRKRQKQKQDHITRRLAPDQPRLRTFALARLTRAQAMLAAFDGAAAGERREFESRVFEVAPYTRNERLRVVPVDGDGTGKPLDLAAYEDDAFWSWAVIEMLALIGPRPEELLELTALDLVPYDARDGGPPLPLLHINPSKTDQERVFPLMPAEADVLAAIIRRVSVDGAVPLVTRYDSKERVWSALLPHLFQRNVHGIQQVIAKETVANLVRRTCLLAGINLAFTPYNFRRLFITDKVNSGFPIHLVAKLVGHERIETTQGYAAVYPEHVVEGYRRHVAQLRQVRPPEEYRDPTEEEMREFHAHFGQRRTRLGRCNRAYGTACPREHQCHRCPLLAVDESGEERLLVMAERVRDEIEQARRDGLLGEVEGLHADLDGIAARLEAARLNRGARALTESRQIDTDR